MNTNLDNLDFAKKKYDFSNNVFLKSYLIQYICNNDCTLVILLRLVSKRVSTT